MTIKLYGHPFSSYCQKAFMAFYEKDVPFELQLVSPDNPTAGAELAALWPMMRFPIVVADGRTILESSVIVEWLDRRRPHPPRLIPADPDAALEARMRDRVFDNYVMTPVQAIVFDRLRPEESRDPFGVKQAHERLDTICAWLDREMASREWAAGDAFGLADCAAAPSLFYAHWVHPLDAWPNLMAYRRRLNARPSFARCIEGGRPYRHFFPGGAPDAD